MEPRFYRDASISLIYALSKFPHLVRLLMHEVAQKSGNLHARDPFHELCSPFFISAQVDGAVLPRRELRGIFRHCEKTNTYTDLALKIGTFPNSIRSGTAE